MHNTQIVSYVIGHTTIGKKELLDSIANYKRNIEMDIASYQAQLIACESRLSEITEKMRTCDVNKFPDMISDRNAAAFRKRYLEEGIEEASNARDELTGCIEALKNMPVMAPLGDYIEAIGGGFDN